MAGSSRAIERLLADLLLACAVSLGGAGAAAAPPMPPSVVLEAAQPPRAKECFDVPYAHQQPDAWCAVNPAAEPGPSFLLFGDSHALQVLEAVEEAARAAGRRAIFTGFSGCAPFLGTVPLTRGDQQRMDCEALNRRVLEVVRASRITDVLLVAKWSYYTDLWNGTSLLNAIGLKPGDPATVEGSRRAFEIGFARTLAAYAELGVRVHVLEQVPQQVYEPRVIYEQALAAAQPQRAIDELSVPLARHRALQAFPAAVFRSAGPVDILSAEGLFCDAERCSAGTALQPFYADLSHLGAAGARKLVPLFTQVLQAAAGSVPK